MNLKEIVQTRVNEIKDEVKNDCSNEKISHFVKDLTFISSTLIADTFNEEKCIIQSTILELEKLKKTI